MTNVGAPCHVHQHPTGPHRWGDCDPAGIVFYPRYFAMFDHSTVLLIEAALGIRKLENVPGL